MSLFLGDWPPGSIVTFTRTTVDGLGQPQPLSAGALRVFQGTATSSASAGVNLTSNFAGVTGLNSVSVDTSQDTAFYAGGQLYSAVLTAGNVSGIGIGGYVFGMFRLGFTSAAVQGTNLVTIAGAAVNTAVAQIGANAVNIAGVAAATSLAVGNVNTVNIAGVAAATSLATGNVNTVNIGGTVAVTSLAGGNVNLATWRGTAPNTLVSGRADSYVGQIKESTIATAQFQAGSLITSVFGAPFLISTSADNTFYNAAADALLDRTNGIESGVTPRQNMRIVGASAAGVLSGAGTTQVGIFGASTANATQRIVATTDQSGNRLAVTLVTT